MEITTLRQAEDFLFSRSAAGMKLGLENIKKLTELTGHPEKKIRAIHIAGTNGKGSTAAILESVLCAAGYTTLLNTSPHLYDVRERIRVCKENISAQDFIRLVNTLRVPAIAAGASFFEIMTCAAFLQSVKLNTDFTILETGLGGRLDATNVAHPLVTVITQISHDHTKTLGSSLESIAAEKAGIFKQGVPCVCGVDQKNLQMLLTGLAGKKQAPILFTDASTAIDVHDASPSGTTFSAKTPLRTYENIHISLAGAHQTANAANVLGVVDELVKQGFSIPGEAVHNGMNSVKWSGRIQVLQQDPTVIIDAAHNTAGMRTLVHTIETQFSDKKLRLVFGVLADKRYTEMLDLIVPLAESVILAKPDSPRACDPADLAAQYDFGDTPVYISRSIADARDKAMARATDNDLVCFAGSIYFIGEILRRYYADTET